MRRAADTDTGRLPTAPDYVGLHRVDAVCCMCDHFAALDLTALIAAGLGDVPLVKLALRCSACGADGSRIIISGRSYGLGEA